jgi:hypothetical protein
MKVSTRFKPWVGPYQVARAIFFWVPEETDEYGLRHSPRFVHNFGHFLAHGRFPVEPTPESPYKESFDRLSWFGRFLQWVYDKAPEPRRVKIEKHDLFCVSYTIAVVMVPLLEKLLESEEINQFEVDDADLPPDLQSNGAEWDYQVNRERVKYVIEQMLFSFRAMIDEPCFMEGEIDVRSKAIEWDDCGKVVLYEIEHGPNHTAKHNDELQEKHNEKVKHGFRLFGKYFQHL